jgi:hypothetical protein
MVTLWSGTNRIAWGLATALAVVVLGGVGALGVQLRPYWVAKYRGQEADLRHAVLVGAPLQGAVLEDANLWSADLRRANLRNAYLGGADLTNADLRGADLRGAVLCQVSSGDGVWLPETIARFRGARYDGYTHWPQLFDPGARRCSPFDPSRHGAQRVR